MVFDYVVPSHMMNYKGTIDFLYALQRHGIKLGLAPILNVLERLGNPQNRYATLHVGGTNGKGSTAAVLASVLHASGYRVGLYTSPHLVCFRERIRINGRLIPEAHVVGLTDQVRGAVRSPLTFFEFTTAMAFQYFADEHVDIAVIEVGMGGRFDATNVLNPLGAIITTVDIDHQQYLGRNITQIAFEKAGIIKAGLSVVLGKMSHEAEKGIRDVAAQQHATCIQLGKEFHVRPGSGSEFHYDGTDWNYPNISCSLIGSHQMRNAGCALALLELVSLKGVNVPESGVRSGLSSVIWAGRVETLELEPRLVVDGAHNPAAAEALTEVLSTMVSEKPDRRLIIIIGMMQDKDQTEFLKTICPLAQHVILTQVSMPRASHIRDLKRVVPTGPYSVHEASRPSEALDVAKRLARPSDMICATGSLFLAGEIKNLLRCEVSYS